MEQFLTNILTHSHGLGAYALIFAVLVACGVGLPLPEDVSLVLGGFLAHLGAARLPVMMAVGFLGILSGDTLIFMAGRRVGSSIESRRGFLSRVVTPEKRAKVQALFARNGEKIVLIARFLPGVRAVTYFTAGSAGMSYGRFIVWDAVAALGSAPLFVYLGFRFGNHLERLVQAIRRGETAVIVCLLALAVAAIVLRRRRSAAARRQQKTPASDASGSGRSESGSAQDALTSTLNSAAESATEEATKGMGSRTW